MRSGGINLKRRERSHDNDLLRKLRLTQKPIEIPLDQTRIHAPRAKRLVYRQHPQKITVRRKPGNMRFAERRTQPVERRIARRSMRDHLGNHRIVERRHRIAADHTAVDANAFTCAESEMIDPPRLRQEPTRRVFRIKPRLEGMAVNPDSSCVTGKASPLATRNCHSTRSKPVIASVTGCST